MDPVGEREGGMNRESCSEIYTLPYVKQIANGKFCVTQKAQPGALWHLEGWDGVEVGGRGHMYTYGWFMLIYGRNQHNIIKQLSSN